ncbi:MAG: efflux RND transporter periplasmic adaptor subunit [Acidobacteriota bacterium]|nr:efflux RND transporter periplasmic adaptor subunit [Acidobacteriota bacterium]
MSERTTEKTAEKKGLEQGQNGNGNGAGDSAFVKKDERVKEKNAETDLPETEPEAENEDAPEENEETAPKKSRKIPIIIGVAAVIIVAIAGTVYWLYARQYESTDDAFIDGDVVQISPKVAAYVTKVYVDSNQEVHKGDLLLELNTQDFEVKLTQAKAALRAAQAQKGASQAQVDLTRKTTDAAQAQATSNVQTTRNNVQQTEAAAGAKQSLINQAQAAVRTAQNNLAQVKATAPQVESNLNLAKIEFNRRQKLYTNGDISRQSLDQATNALQSAQSQYNAALKEIDAAASRVGEARANVNVTQENYRQSLAQVNLTQSQVNESNGRLQDANAAPERIAVSESQISTSQASIEQAQAAVQQAELDLSYTKVYAPEDGFIARKNVEEGQFVQPGAALIALSQSDEIWVTANFKETQLELMRVGQVVEIKVDAYPNEKFEGKIQSFQSGTGSRFSVLPTENATGNYVKVVQRIPVKIVFDKQPSEDKAHLLAPGMSVEPSVKVR